jgi:hypothetical protein
VKGRWAIARDVLSHDHGTETGYYSSATAVTLLNAWYRCEKEEAFIDFALRGLAVPALGPVVEIGGGAGLQGVQIQRHFGDRYIHTDLSQPLVESARQKGLQSWVADGLAMPLRSGSVAAVLLVGTSTVIGGEKLRIAQFREVSRILMTGGVCVIVTSMLSWFKAIHRLDRGDLQFMADCGLDTTTRRRWGIVPGRFWGRPAKPILEGVERVCSAAGLGIRQIVVASKR